MPQIEPSNAVASNCRTMCLVATSSSDHGEGVKLALQTVANDTAATEDCGVPWQALRQGPILDVVMSQLAPRDIRGLAGAMNDRQIHALARPRHDALAQVLGDLDALAGDKAIPQFRTLSEALFGWVHGVRLLSYRSIEEKYADREALERALEDHDRAVGLMLEQASTWTRSNAQTKAAVRRLESAHRFIRVLLDWVGQPQAVRGPGAPPDRVLAARWSDMAHLLTEQPAPWRVQLFQAYCVASPEPLITYLPALRQYPVAERVALLEVLLPIRCSSLAELELLIQEASELQPAQRLALASDMCMKSWQLFERAQMDDISTLNALAGLVCSTSSRDVECHHYLYCIFERMVHAWARRAALRASSSGPLDDAGLIAFATHLGRLACATPCPDMDYSQAMHRLAQQLWPSAPERQAAFMRAYLPHSRGH